MESGLVRCQRTGGIAVLTLNNPERRNALSVALLAELKACLDSIGRDRATRVVVLRAEGPVFSAGHDLRELAAASDQDATRIFAACTQVMESIRLLPQPVIAQVQGLATAAGCQMVAACDLAVASEDAAFATPGVKIGLFCTTPGVALARAISVKKAMEMLLTGETVSAHEAMTIGLVNKVVPAAELETATMDLAGRIASFSGEVMALGKSAFYKHVEMDWTGAYQYAERVMAENLRRSEAREGIDAFLTKRPPRWPD